MFVPGVKQYEVKLSLGGSDVVPWTVIRRQRDVTFDGLTLVAGEYMFSVRALSLSGLMSEEASVPVTFTDQAPTDSGMLETLLIEIKNLCCDINFCFYYGTHYHLK